MGSSKGKDIIFFGLIALFLILRGLFSKKIKNFPKSGNYYLKIAIFVTTLSIILPLSLEVILRLNLGLDIFTIFIIPEPNYATTSLLHSHIFKSIVGDVISSIMTNIPSGIHTGSSLTYYVPWISRVIIIILPVLFLTSFLSLKDRLVPSKILLIFSLTCTLIGILDGNLFATPTIIGIYGILIVFFDEMHFDYIFLRLFKNKKMLNCFIERSKEYKLKKKKSKFKTIFKRSVPHLILISIILLRLTLSFACANQEYYEVDLIEPNLDNLNLNNLSSSLDGLEVKSFFYEDNKLKIRLDPNYNEYDLTNKLAKALSNKTKGFSLSWNGFSFLHCDKNVFK
jgi:hypothetical protein